MLRREEIIAYAMEFAGYLIKKCKIKKIILHGSISRGDFDEESDIDLFIETDEKEKKIQELKEKFYKTEVYKKCKLKGLENEISIIVGDLEGKEWENLKRAVLNTGILLFGKYKSNIEKNYQYIIFTLENIKPDKKRIAVFRKLFGFKIGKKKYPGLISKVKGIKLGKSSIIIPAENSKQVKDYLKEKKITPKIYDVWSDVVIES